MKNVLVPLAKSHLIPFGLTDTASAANTGIHKNILGLRMTALVISNTEMKDIMKIVEYLEYSGLLIKDATKAIGNESKEWKGGLIGILVGTLGASLVAELLTGKDVYVDNGVI